MHFLFLIIRGLLFSLVNDDANSNKNKNQRQPLGNTQTSKHETVRPHTLNNHPTKPIPNQIEGGDFSLSQQLRPTAENNNLDKTK